MLIKIYFFKGHHFQTNFPHAHHVMPKMRRKKKTSISSDGGDGSDGEGEHKRHHHKRKSSKKEVALLPTIDDESKVQVYIITISD